MFLDHRRAKTISPEKIWSIYWAGSQALSLYAAVQFDLFTHIAKGRKTAKEIARAAKCSANATERLLNVMVGLDLIKKKDGQYELDSASELFLVRDRPSYIGRMIMNTPFMIDGWKNLPQSVQSGKSIASVNKQEQGEAFFADLVRSLFPLSFSTSLAAAAMLKKRGMKFERILDVAAGSAAWSLGFAAHYSEARVTALDFPGVLKVTQEFVAQQKAESRYDYLSGDLNDVALGKNVYDLIILGHICHSEGEKRSRKLIKKSAQALRKGGALLIAEVLPNEERTGPLQSLLFSLNMLLFTQEGDVFSAEEFREWTSQAGLKKFEALNGLPAVSPLLLAVKE